MKKHWLQIAWNMGLKIWSQVGTCSAKLFAINPGSPTLEKQIFSCYLLHSTLEWAGSASIPLAKQLSVREELICAGDRAFSKVMPCAPAGLKKRGCEQCLCSHFHPYVEVLFFRLCFLQWNWSNEIC